MYGVDLYGRVRLAVLGQGLSQREAARRFGIDRGTVSYSQKWCFDLRIKRRPGRCQLPQHRL